MYKVGDRVETYKEIQEVESNRMRRVKGRICGIQPGLARIALDDSPVEWTYFSIKDLLATDVLRLKVGDKVKMRGDRAGAVVGQGYLLGSLLVRASGPYVIRTENWPFEDLVKVDDPDEGGQRWSFKSNKDTFDGARVIRELLEVGADYAAVTVDGIPVGLFSSRLARRAEAIGVYTLAGRSWSAGLVGLSTPIGVSLRVVFEDSSGPGYRQVAVGSTADFAAMVAELEKKEAEAKQFVTHVEWGKAGK